MDVHGNRKRLQVCLPPAVVDAVIAHRERMRTKLRLRTVSDSAALADLIERGLGTVEVVET